MTPPPAPGALARLPALGMVVAGGCIGTALRMGFGGAQSALSGPGAADAMPPRSVLATLTVNLLGSFALGVLTGRLAGGPTPRIVGQRLRLLLGTGLCGGFTTYSAFAVEVITQAGRGSAGAWWGTAYAVTSVTAGVLCALLGLIIGRRAADPSRAAGGAPQVADAQRGHR